MSGTGAMLFGGRWNKKGTRMLYTSESLSLAALEIIANLSSNKLSQNFYCVEIELPDNLEIIEIEKLPNNWNAFPFSGSTPSIGSDFFTEGGFCLKVPSAIIPSEYNFLINPVHIAFDKLHIRDKRPLILDRRLVKGSE
jgi:RES domain-containing protein